MVRAIERPVSRTAKRTKLLEFVKRLFKIGLLHNKPSFNIFSKLVKIPTKLQQVTTWLVRLIYFYCQKYPYPKVILLFQKCPHPQLISMNTKGHDFRPIILPQQTQLLQTIAFFRTKPLLSLPTVPTQTRTLFPSKSNPSEQNTIGSHCSGNPTTCLPPSLCSHQILNLRPPVQDQLHYKVPPFPNVTTYS